MLPRPFHGYNPDAADRVALVSVEPSADRQLHLVRVARGPTRQLLRPLEALGPYPEDEVGQRFAEAVEALRAEGYWPGGLLALLDALADPRPAVRARAALRLGWRRCPEAVGPLLALLPRAVDECCSVLDALGRIGDPKAIPAVRDYAARKLLSRRRSAVEALHNLEDADGLAEARHRSLERLPESLRPLLTAEPGRDLSAAVPTLVRSLHQLDAAQQALALDTLYELAEPVPVAAARRFLAEVPFREAYLWRSIKSIFKRSMLRRDAVTFGWLAHQIEAQGWDNVHVVASVKSGYDGAARTTAIFGRKTRDYLRAAAWRYLRDLASYRPDEYTAAAAEAVIHYTPDEVQRHGGLGTGGGGCYLLHQILLGGSDRFYIDYRRLVFRLRYSRWGNKAKKPTGREEAHPELWDAYPKPYLRLLGHARLPEVHAFAVAAVRDRHPNLLRQAAHRDVLAMLQAPYEPTVQLALAELDRRFDPEKPDWLLLAQMLADERPAARTLGQKWLRLTAHLWLPEVDRVLDFLSVEQQNIRALVVELVTGALPHNPTLRRDLAARLALILRTPEPAPGAYTGYAEVAAQALADEMDEALSVDDLLAMLLGGADTVKILAGALLRRRPDAFTRLGLERLTALANDELADVRAAAHAVLRSGVAHLRADPSALFALAESDWEDTRECAFTLLRERIDLAALGLDGFVGLLDSLRTDVQDLGKELTQKYMTTLPGEELVRRLAEHPDPNMRHFVLEMAVQHLPQRGESLAGMKTLCRSALFDLWPSRAVKNFVIDFVAARGVEDADQAAVAASILGDLVRAQGRDDFERALESLVRIRLAHPDVPTTVELLPGGVV